jgi:hypothetical protein
MALTHGSRSTASNVCRPGFPAHHRQHNDPAAGCQDGVAPQSSSAAAELVITLDTVKRGVAQILNKLGVDNRTYAQKDTWTWSKCSVAHEEPGFLQGPHAGRVSR